MLRSTPQDFWEMAWSCSFGSLPTPSISRSITNLGIDNPRRSWSSDYGSSNAHYTMRRRREVRYSKRHSVPDVLEQLLDLRLFIGSQRQQRQTRPAAEHAVEIHGVLHTGDAQLADNAHCG